jgi:uncharacterized protein (DUF433 family)
MEQEYVEHRDGGFYLKGTRVPLDAIVHEFRLGVSAESIRQAFPTLTLEQVYGAVAYYLRHQAEVDSSLEEADRAWLEFESAHPAPESIKASLHAARDTVKGRR